MKKSIVLTNMAITITALLILVLAAVWIVDGTNRKNAESQASLLVDLYEQRASEGDSVEQITRSIPSAAGKMRVTVISSDGTVLGDSVYDQESLENHLQRDEIQGALAGRRTSVLRYSSTMRKQALYCAEAVEIDGQSVILRVALPMTDISYYFNSTVVLFLIILAVVGLISYLVSSKINGYVIKPFQSVEQSIRQLNRGVYQPAYENARYPEINEILRGINDISAKLVGTMQELSAEKEKLSAILNGMNEGLIVVDKGLHLVLVNRYAERLFGSTSDLIGNHISYLVDSAELCGFVEDSVGGVCGGHRNFSVEERFYDVNVYAIDAENSAVVLTDTTVQRQAEETRSVFFANAGHELKTPLTSVRGFAELLTTQCDQQQVKRYAAQILHDTDRMLFLLEDMLSLSSLEHTPEFANAQPVRLEEVVREVFESLAARAAERRIELTLEGQATVLADRERIYELVLNLADNAVKYNNPEGSVQILLSQSEQGTRLIVRDSGIGIDPEHQGHVFERFYRVEKSRSRKLGGTGLGLAIVKHICEKYCAGLELKSQPGVGTEITVSFPADMNG